MSYEEEFKNRLKNVSIELSQLEKLLSENGIDVPNSNISLSDDEKIWLPIGYIRTVSYYLNEYHLNKIFNDKIIARNIAYALQASDLFNYFLNRFRIGLSVGRIFFKHAIINHFSIIEALLYGIVKQFHDFCFFENSVCRYNTTCFYYFKNAEKYTFEQLIQKLIDNELLNIPSDIKNKLLLNKGLRDNIHIWDTNSKDYFNEEYCLENYNFLVLILKLIRDDLKNSIDEFKKRRNNNCKMLTKRST